MKDDRSHRISPEGPVPRGTDAVRGRGIQGLAELVPPGNRISETRSGNLAWSRREFLWRFGGGLGGVALAHLLGEHGLLAGTADSSSALTSAAIRGILRDGPHQPARARRVIQLFMNGGASQIDLFDYKPELVKRHGQKFDPGTNERVEAATSEPGTVLKPAFEFRQRGQCGRWVSSLLPHVATRVDDMAFLMAMVSKTNVHGPGS